MDDELGYIVEGLRGLAVPIDQVHEDAANARTGHAVDRIAGSLRVYGQRKPIVANRLEGGKVVAGNGTLRAARSLGWGHIAVVWVEDDAARAAGFGIADNRVGDLSRWDVEALEDLMTALPDDAFTGFEVGELEELLGDGGKGGGADAVPQVDRAEELRVKWGVELGQLWRLPSRTPGQEHRLICGDCTDGGVVERVMGGERADMVVTDPPYGVNYDPSWRGDIADRLPSAVHGGKIINDDNLEWMKAFSHIPCDVLYVWSASVNLFEVQAGLSGYGFITKYLIIWNKDLPVLGRGAYHWKHEQCLYVVRKGANMNWQGARNESTVWDIPTIHSFKNGNNSEEWGLVGHSAQKPLECMERPIRNNSAAGQIIADIFLGSGTTLIASENLGRQCRAVEVSPGYVAVALQRYVDAFGIEPVLVDGVD